MKEESQAPMTPIDVIACGNNLQILKALIPYFRQETQLSLACIVKVLEIQNLVSFFRDSGSLRAQSPSEDPLSPLEILEDISPYFPPSGREQMQQGIQLLEMMKLFQSMNTEDGGNQSDFLKTMLSPEQQSLFETYQTMFSMEEPGKEQNIDE